jgi:hypothetical protein
MVETIYLEYGLSLALSYLEENPDRRVRDSRDVAEQRGFIVC